jgi:signal transduction histidine kinase
LPPEPFGRPFDDLLPPGHPYRDVIRGAIEDRQSRGPVSSRIPGPDGAGSEDGPERLLMAHAIRDRNQQLIGVMLVARDVATLGRVQSMLSYSRKLMALGRLSAGVAHEVKNPLNAMTIHLELLKQKLLVASGAGRRAAAVPVGEQNGRVSAQAAPAVAVDDNPELGRALEHVRVIGGEIQRLDQVMQGFLKFTRSEDLKLQALSLGALIDDVVRVIEPECANARVAVVSEGFEKLPDISGDPTMLRQAFLNLALNACQAMPNGGTLRLSAARADSRRVRLSVSDTGIGIKPEHLDRIFDLYFTTRPKGSGIGLSMVYRTVQLHDGEIEVESTEGTGTTFTLLLPEA